jgi:hypothetical protein
MRLVIVMLLLATMPLAFLPAYAQPSCAPPSSLPAISLSPSFDPNGIGSCDLCRPLEGRRGSDLERHRRFHDPDLHLHKKTPGITKSPKRSFKNQLPHRKLEEHQDGVER